MKAGAHQRGRGREEGQGQLKPPPGSPRRRGGEPYGNTS